MKVFRLFVFVLAVSLGVASCTTDDDVDSIAGNRYETTYVKMEMTGEFTLSVEYKTKAECIENETYSIIEFKSDGKFWVDNEETGTWTQSDESVTITETDEEGTDIITGTIDGDVIKITMNETEDGSTINMEMHFTKM